MLELVKVSDVSRLNVRESLEHVEVAYLHISTNGVFMFVLLETVDYLDFLLYDHVVSDGDVTALS